MGRSEKEIKDLLGEVKKWFTEEMGLPYKHDLVSDLLEEMKKVRISRFISRRLGHLPDEDLINFIKACKEDSIPPPAIPVVQPKIEVSRGRQATKR